jgi:pyrophosphate--fructose-6-phosphate 1-phosphotransferase
MVALSERLRNHSSRAFEAPDLFRIKRPSFSSELVPVEGREVHVLSIKEETRQEVEETPNVLVRMASQIHVFKVGVVFAANSCCASGVNNVLTGLWTQLCESGKIFQLVGIQGGPSGLASESVISIGSERDWLRGIHNLGGIELLGYGSFSDVSNMNSLKTACLSLELTSLVIVAASDELPQSVELVNLLTETDIVACIVPQSRNQHVFIPNGLCGTSLGFDSARRVLAELAGNIAVDCLASKKYWHFINAGDAQLVAEVGMLIRANMIVTEADVHIDVSEWISRVVKLIEDRQASGLRSGVVMVSQCAFSRTIGMQKLIEEIASIPTFPVPESLARKTLTRESFSLLSRLPKEVRLGLLRQRDRNGQPVLIYWSPEEFLVEQVQAALGKVSTIAFRTHFLAHESRCPVPTKFDCILGSCLGRTAGTFVIHKKHGLMASVKNLGSNPDAWVPIGVSVSGECAENIVRQRGYELTPIVKQAWEFLEPKWRLDSRYRSFGPLQIDNEELTVPFSISENSLVAWLDGSGQCGESREVPGAVPPIRLPVRRISDMSPLETERRYYDPTIPSYLTDPFLVVDSDICARVSGTDPELVDKVFPFSSKLLPVEVVNVASIEEGQDRLVSPTTTEFAQRKYSSFDLSEGSDSDGEAPGIGLRIESKIHIPLLQRFDQLSTAGETLLSPRSSARTVPPERPQLVRVSDLFRKNQSIRQEEPPKREDSTDSIVGVSTCERVGIVFMCSQVPGCHNVVSGLFDYLDKMPGHRTLIGFLGGSTGLRNGWTQILTADLVDRYRNQGGQDLLGHFGESLQTDEHFEEVVGTIKNLMLDGLVIAGNLEGQLATALLSEKLLETNSACKIISVPVSAENEIPFVRQSVGYDTVTRVFSNTIGNLWTECHSSRRRWYFVRLMSHHVSHLALECGLATHPNIVLVTEEVAARQQSLSAITEMIADCICARSREGKNFGVVLIPDGVVAAVPQIRRLLRELDKIVGSKQCMRLELVTAQLSVLSAAIFEQLPRFVQAHLVNGALRHAETGKIDIANVAMERILQTLVGIELGKRKMGKIDLLVHALAHQGRSSLPSSFDCDLAYTCGYCSGILLDAGKTGLVTNVAYHKIAGNDQQSREEYVWSIGGFPAVNLISIQETGKDVRISIEPTKLEMSGRACRALFASMPEPPKREGRHPGPLQWTSNRTLSQLSEGNREQWESFEQIAAMCKEILSLAGQQVDRNPEVIHAVLRSLENILHYEDADMGQKTTGRRQLKANIDWFLVEPDDILSTCAPQKIVVSESLRGTPVLMKSK